MSLEDFYWTFQNERTVSDLGAGGRSPFCNVDGFLLMTCLFTTRIDLVHSFISTRQSQPKILNLVSNDTERLEEENDAKFNIFKQHSQIFSMKNFG